MALALSERDTKRAGEFIRPNDIRPNDFVSIGERDAKRFNDFSSLDLHDAKKANNFSSIEVRSNDPDSWLREYFRVDATAEQSGSQCPISLANLANALPSMSSLEDMQPDGPICPYCKEEMQAEHAEAYTYKCQTPLGMQEVTYKVYKHMCEAHGYGQFSDLREFWTNAHPDFKHLAPVRGPVEWQKKCIPCTYEGQTKPDTVYCATIRGRMWTRCGYCNGLHMVDPANKAFYPKHMCPNYQADSLMTSLRVV